MQKHGTHSEHLTTLPDGWSATIETAPLPDGREKKGLRLHRSDSVHLIALTEAGTVLLLREFRAFLGKYVWMLPSGKADKEADLTVAAQRELREETGYESKDLQPYCTFYATDTMSIRNHVFVAHDLQPNPLPQDATELIEVHELSLQEAIQNVLMCDPIHAVSAAALLRYDQEKTANI